MDYLSQVQRDREATSRHDHFYVIRQRYYYGRPVDKWMEEHTVVETRDEAEMLKVLTGSDTEGPVAVIEVDVRAGTCTDISKEIALRVSEWIRDGKADLTDDLRDFIEEYFMPGSVLPAAA